MLSSRPTFRVAWLRAAMFLASAWLLAAVATPPATAQPASATPQDAAQDAATYAGTIELRGGGDAPVRFSMQSSGALRLLDTQGLPIESSLNHELARQADIDRLSGPIRLRGMYRYLADAASLTECITGKRWPVLIEGAHLALERAYLAQRIQPGSLLLVALTASFVWREPEPGLRPREMLRVEEFEGLWPGETCAG